MPKVRSPKPDAELHAVLRAAVRIADIHAARDVAALNDADEDLHEACIAYADTLPPRVRRRMGSK